ncbi:MAG: O-antigen ligase family protein [Aquificaceae bacterium]|nr:O-antigen ligase family protein [Aquificaceae bacterium]MDW8423149.1 O-antigen ligase family protein [Aquificaceae bacterium]
MLIVLFTFALLSITLFEALVILILIYLSFRAIRGKTKLGGKLFLPLVLHAISALTSTLLYYPAQFGKAVERSIFLLAYPFGGLMKMDEKSLFRFNLFLVFMGLILIPLVFYRYRATGQPAMIWGGWFEVGAFYTIFAVASLSLFFYTRRIYYLLPFIIFVSIVFFTARRSAMLGLAFALILFAILTLKNLSKKALLGIIGTLIVGFGISTTLLVEKDPRYKTAFEVIGGERDLEDETLNIISSYRWEIAKAGIEVIKRDFEEGNWIPLLIGHGINSGYYLEPKSPVGGVYESVFILSEFIEKGILGLLSVLWVYWVYLRFLINFRILGKSDYLLMPMFLALGSHLMSSIFTFFWDAMLPLYLIMFRVVESFKGEGPAYEPYPQAQKNYP